MELLLSLFLVFVGLQEPTSQNAFFIPVPSAFAPVAKFGCPDPGTVFTYDVMAWNTKRPNRIVAIEQDELSCWVRSDAWGKYEWFGGLGARLGDEDLAEKSSSPICGRFASATKPKPAATISRRDSAK